MKTILYVFAIGWFLTGLAALVGGQQFWMGSTREALPSATGTMGAVAAGWVWVWTFPLPALLAGALAAVLGRLDEIREAIDFSNEHEDVDETQREPEGRVPPFIGESYLNTRPEETGTPSKKNHPHF